MPVFDGVLDPVTEALGVCSGGGQRAAGQMVVQTAPSPRHPRSLCHPHHPLTCDAVKLTLAVIEPVAVSEAEMLAVPVAVELKLGLCGPGRCEGRRRIAA